MLISRVIFQSATSIKKQLYEGLLALTSSFRSFVLIIENNKRCKVPDAFHMTLVSDKPLKDNLYVGLPSFSCRFYVPILGSSIGLESNVTS